MLEFNIILKCDAYDVTKFYTMLTFCIHSTDNKLFKIVFLFETTFIFPQLYLSHEVCMIYPDFYWLSAYPYPLWACPPLCGLGAWDFLSMAIKITIFRRYLCFTRLKNLFKNCIFVISVQNCILQLNFKAQFLLIKIQLIIAKSQIQATWHHLLPGNFFKSETFNNYFRTVFAHLRKLTMQ